MFNNGASNPRGRAMVMATLRAVVAGYLIYLGGSLIYGQLKGESEMIPWVAWFFGIFFILAGGAFGIYTWKRYKKESTENPEEAPEETTEETSGEAVEASSEETPEITEEKPSDPEDEKG